MTDRCHGQSRHWGRTLRPCTRSNPISHPPTRCHSLVLIPRWHASPEKPGKHLHSPVTLSQFPALEHSAWKACGEPLLMALEIRDTHARPLEHIPDTQAGHHNDSRSERGDLSHHETCFTAKAGTSLPERQRSTCTYALSSRLASTRQSMRMSTPHHRNRGRCSRWHTALQLAGLVMPTPLRLQAAALCCPQGRPRLPFYVAVGKPVFSLLSRG